MKLRSLAGHARQWLPARVRPVARRLYRVLIGDPRELLRYYGSEDPALRGGWDQLESRFHWLVDNLTGRIPSRRQEGYLTHLPVLFAVAMETPVRRVLELGCGDYSTLAFLDRSSFPDLERLVSLENYPEWAERVRKLAADDRLEMKLVEGPLADALGALDLESFDVIFVDDALTRDERVRTIRALAGVGLKHPVVVVHDFDMPVYRKAASGFRRRLRFIALYPNTGVAWNRPGFEGRLIEEMNGLVSRYQEEIPLGDRVAHQRWLEERSGQLSRRPAGS